MSDEKLKIEVLVTPSFDKNLDVILFKVDLKPTYFVDVLNSQGLNVTTIIKEKQELFGTPINEYAKLLAQDILTACERITKLSLSQANDKEDNDVKSSVEGSNRGTEQSQGQGNLDKGEAHQDSGTD